MLLKNKSNISIVIPCFEDNNIFELLNNLDGDSPNITREYIVVLGRSERDCIKTKLKRLNKDNLKIFSIEKGNLSKSFNKGIENSSFENILILNSDLIKISKNYLDGLVKIKKKTESEIVKSEIIFLHNSFLTKIISLSRRLGHDDTVYNPGILIDKKVFKKIGLFNEKIKYSEDGEFDMRVKKNGIRYVFDKNNYIVHPPIGINHDLKMASLIGRGKLQAVRYAGARDNEEICNTLFRYFSFQTIGPFLRKTKKWGLLTAIYDILWGLFYYMGNYGERIMKNEK